MKKQKIYKIKSLIDGHKIGPEYKKMTLVCCRSDRCYTHIEHEGSIMKLPEEPIKTIQFEDMYKRGIYFLDYYIWEPIKAADLWSKI